MAKYIELSASVSVKSEGKIVDEKKNEELKKESK
jgi:hypothetical protein